MSNQQKQVSQFEDRSVAYGLQEGDFLKIDHHTRQNLIKLMARISEKSYRRGFQHGQYFANEGEAAVDGFELRNGDVPLDRSPYTDTFYPDGSWASKSGFSAIERLLMEYGEVRVLLMQE